MIVFKTFLKVLKSNIIPILMYTIFLIAFGGFNMTTNDNSTNFVATKPDILIINNDEEVGITQNLIKYLESNTNIIKVKNNENAINDALFYRDVNYIIYIPNSFRENFLNHKEPKIQVKSTGDYKANFAKIILERYIQVANLYNKTDIKEEEILKNIEDTLSKQVEIELTTKLDTDNLSNAIFYYNFASYSLLAGCIYVICLILSSFKKENIRKRTIISSINYKDYNRKLLLSNSLFAFCLWLVYILLSFILLGSIMFTLHGLILIINSFVFTFCTLTLAFLIGNLIHNKNTINGIVNVLALGSSFLCGAFVPVDLLPNTALQIAHILPSYYYINTNELLKKIELFNLTNILPIIKNTTIIILFSLLFIIITNMISKRKNKIG